MHRTHEHDHDDLAERTTRMLSHLEGALDATMLDAMQGAWAMLERSAVSPEAHARAVRARLLWETLAPNGVPLPASEGVSELVATWEDEAATDAA